MGYPEGPVYQADGSVLVTEIKTGKLTRVLPGGAQATVAQLGGAATPLARMARRMFATTVGFSSYAWIRRSTPSWAAATGSNADATTKAMAASAAAQIWLTGNQPPNYTGGSIQRVDLKTGEFSTLYTGFVTGSSASMLAVETGLLKSPDDLVFDSSGGYWLPIGASSGAGSAILRACITPCRMDRASRRRSSHPTPRTESRFPRTGSGCMWPRPTRSGFSTGTWPRRARSCQSAIC